MKKRILFVQNRLTFGGTSSLIMFIVRNLSDEYIFDLFCYEDGAPELEKEFIGYGGSIIKDKRLHCSDKASGKLKQYRLKFFGGIQHIFKNNILANKYCVIHCFEEFSSSYYLKASASLGIKKRIVHFCNDQKQKRKMNFIAKLLRRKETKLINKYATNIVGDSFKSFSDALDSSKATMILDPIDKRFAFSNSTPNNLTLVQVGSFCDNKNQLFSLSVLDILRKKYGLHNSNLIMVGPCSKENFGYKKEIENKIIELDLIDNVFIKQATLDLPQIFSESSYMIFPSKKESFGMVLIEAQACGLYCFSSYAAAKETDLGGVTFVELNEGAENWAKIIYNFYSINHGKKNKYIVSKHSQETIRKEFLKLYEQAR